MFKVPNVAIPPTSWRTRAWHCCWLSFLVVLVLTSWTWRTWYDAATLLLSIGCIVFEVYALLRNQHLQVVRIQAPPIATMFSDSINRNNAAILNSWRLITKSGKQLPANILSSTRVTPWLIYLHLQLFDVSDENRKFKTLLWRKEVSETDWRDLCAYLKY